MKKVSLILFSLIISFFLAEILLRVAGFQPWEYQSSNKPIIYKEDQILGWKSVEGLYEFNKDDKSRSFFMNIENFGNRFNGKKINTREPSILFIGGSFTQGHGVDDNKTFAYRIQKKFNNYSVVNYGHGGYGGLQSLLLLKEEIIKFEDPRLIVYGFIDHHEYRNVARSAWLATLTKHLNQNTKKPKVPYATLNDNEDLIINAPISYITIPLRENLASVVLLEKFLNKQISKKRKRIQKKVTKKIIKNMDKLSSAYNSKFLVVILNWSNQYSNEEYKKYLVKNKINFVDCKIKLDNETLLKNDYHPNSKGHELYGNCILNYINKEKLLL